MFFADGFLRTFVCKEPFTERQSKEQCRCIRFQSITYQISEFAKHDPTILKSPCAEVPQIAFWDACLRDDAGTGCGILQGIVVLERDSEVLRHGIQRVGWHFGEEVAADDEAVGVVE